MIAKSLGLSRSAVWECIRRAKAVQLTWPLPEDLSESDLHALLYEPTPAGSERTPPDCDWIFNQLKIKGVTVSLLWEEYKRENPHGYQYTQFSEIYRRWRKKADLVMRQQHKAGHKAFSDFSGGKLRITDPATGEVRLAPLFVCALGASSFTYAEPFFSESAEAWCTGQANAFQYFGGSTEIIVPDNPRAVITRACPYEPDVHSDFLLLAEHFGCAVVPARVRKPKDKAKVESAVGLATRWILARLRHQTFFSLAEAKVAVGKLLQELNDRPFKKLPGCRKSLFESIEKSALKQLPKGKYEYVRVQYAKVNIDYHIEIGKCYYSVPHQLVGKRVEARIGPDAVEIFFNGRRVASHPKTRCPGQARTVDEHMPKTHRAYKDWTPARIKDWASTIGPSTATFVEELMARKKYPELAYRSSLGIIRLAKQHGSDRLEGACQRAIAIGCYSYKNVKLILQNNMDCRPLPAHELPTQLQLIHTNIRGASYYARQREEEKC